MSNDDYAVGYRKPPKHSQFKKGQSGNPKGRSRTSKKSVEDDLNEVLSTRIKITEYGKITYISGQKALFKKLLNDGMKGDHRACKLLIDLGMRQYHLTKAKKDSQLYEEFKKISSMSDEELQKIIDQ